SWCASSSAGDSENDMTLPHAKPLQLITVEQARAADPGFVPGWARASGAEQGRVLFDPEYGAIHHVVVADVVSGRPLYDLPIRVGPGGVVVLPIDAQGRLGLIHHYRVCALSPETPNRFPEPLELETFGQWSWEIPRGFSDPTDASDQEAAQRELVEEMHLSGLDLGGELDGPPTCVGHLIPDTSGVAGVARPVAMFVARLKKGRDVHDAPSPSTDEPIRTVRYFTLDELMAMTRTGELMCGFTRAVLWEAFTRGLLVSGA
ncbi:MAG: NUDIX hydrolase, partial [Myxococcota bacterium]